MKLCNKFILTATLAVMFLSVQAYAADEMIFRTDSGLIQAEALLKSGNYTAALQSTTNVLLKHSRNADAYTYRGYAYYKLGQIKQAQESFDTALMINPSHLGANKYKANIFIDEGRIDRAIEQLQALRIICGNHNCAEIDLLEIEINNATSKK